MHHHVLETDRLRLRPLAPGDAQAAFAWLGDPEVNRFMPYALYTSAEQAREWLESLAESDDPTLEFGFVRKSDGLLIGSGGIGPNEEGVWEVGYNLRRDCWGQGYASEAARAMIRFAHDSLGAREFGGNCAAANPASGRVLEKCGMRFDHLGEYARFDGSEVFPAKFYRMTLQ